MSNTIKPTKKLQIESLFRGLLGKIGESDKHQIRLVFDSIDVNHDGSLSVQELEEFALQLG